LKFDCSLVRLSSCVNLYRRYNLMVCQKWIDLALHWVTFRSISEMLSYERIGDLMSLLTISFEHIHVLWEHTGGQSVYVRILFTVLPLRLHQKTPSKNKFTTYQAQITGLELSNSVLWWLYLKIAKKNYHKIYFLVDNFCNFEVISNSNILKQIYKKEEYFSKNPN
jgi:hypothetical protein